MYWIYKEKLFNMCISFSRSDRNSLYRFPATNRPHKNTIFKTFLEVVRFKKRHGEIN